MECNTLDVYTVEKVKSPNPQTVKLSLWRHPVAEGAFATSLHHEHVASSLYGYQAPRCFTIFLKLTSPGCSMESFFHCISVAAPAQPPVLLYQESARWCSWGGSRCAKLALGYRSQSLPPPLASHTIQASCYKWKSRTGRKGTKEVGENCISDTVWAQTLTQPRWLSKAGMELWSWGWFSCTRASLFAPTWQPEKRTVLTTWEGNMLLERPDNLEGVFPLTNNSPSCKLHCDPVECVFRDVWS